MATTRKYWAQMAKNDEALLTALADRRPIMIGTWQAKKTDLLTATGERIYDLLPLAGDLWAIAGPDGLDPTTVAIKAADDLPEGYRWIEDDEWENAVREREYRIDPHSR